MNVVFQDVAFFFFFLYLTSFARRDGSEIHPPCCVGQ